MSFQCVHVNLFTRFIYIYVPCDYAFILNKIIIVVVMIISLNMINIIIIRIGCFC